MVKRTVGEVNRRPSLAYDVLAAGADGEFAGGPARTPAAGAVSVEQPPSPDSKPIRACGARGPVRRFPSPVAGRGVTHVATTHGPASNRRGHRPAGGGRTPGLRPALGHPGRAALPDPG